jgi:hypothetical protein
MPGDYQAAVSMDLVEAAVRTGRRVEAAAHVAVIRDAARASR